MQFIAVGEFGYGLLITDCRKGNLGFGCCERVSAMDSTPQNNEQFPQNEGSAYSFSFLLTERKGCISIALMWLTTVNSNYPGDLPGQM